MTTVFVILVLGGILAGSVSGNPEVVTVSLVEASFQAVNRCIQLLGILSIWLGIARVAEKSGYLKFWANLLSPLLARFFPDIPKGHPALAYITMNLTANVFGFGSAATPFGLKAMKELQKLNPTPKAASRPMCTFLAINTSNVTLVPSTMIALRTSLGSASPENIVVSTLIATTASTVSAVLLDAYFRKRDMRRRNRL